jgi:hypothetical protein
MAPKSEGTIAEKKASKDMMGDIQPKLDELSTRIDRCDQGINSLKNTAVLDLQKQIDKLASSIPELKAELKADVQSLQTATDDAVSSLGKKADANLEAINMKFDELQSDLFQMGAKFDAAIDELKKADEAEAASRRELEAKLSQDRQDALDRDIRDKKELDDTLRAVCKDIETQKEKVQQGFSGAGDHLKTAISSLNDQLTSLDNNHSKKKDKMENSIKDDLAKVRIQILEIIAKESADQSATTSALRESREAAERAVRKDMAEFERQTGIARMEMMKDFTTRLTDLDDRSTYAMHVVERTNNSMQNIKWRIASADLEGRNKVSMFTKPFPAHGLRGFKLELRVEKHPDGTDMTLGDSSLYLWAPKGVRVAFRLWVGEPQGEQSKGRVMELEHTYLQESRFGAKSFFQLAHFMGECLNVGVELLEVEHELDFWDGTPGGPLDPRGARQPDATLGDGRVVDGETAKVAAPPMGTKVSAVALSNLRVEELIRKQLTLLQTRYCKKSEWKIARADEIVNMYPPGRALCSKTFCCGGLEDLQFVIYPRGMGGADGYCSLLISAPAGASIKGNIYLGKQVRPLEHTWTERGQYGRANFCRWDNAVENDVVVVALELHECSMSLPEVGGLKLLSHVPSTALVDVQELPRAPQAMVEEKTPAAKRAFAGTLSPVDPGPRNSKGKQKDKHLAWLRKVPAPLRDIHTAGPLGQGAGVLGSLQESTLHRPHSTDTLPPTR